MSNFSLARAIAVLPQEPIIRFREEVGDRVGGFRSGSGFVTSPPFNAHVQPTTAAQMKMLEGGEHVEGAITLWTHEELRTSQEVGSLQADRIERRGRFYKVVQELDWIGQGFRMYIAGTTRMETV